MHRARPEPSLTRRCPPAEEPRPTPRLRLDALQPVAPASTQHQPPMRPAPVPRADRPQGATRATPGRRGNRPDPVQHRDPARAEQPTVSSPSVSSSRVMKLNASVLPLPLLSSMNAMNAINGALNPSAALYSPSPGDLSPPLPLSIKAQPSPCPSPSPSSPSLSLALLVFTPRSQLRHTPAIESLLAQCPSPALPAQHPGDRAHVVRRRASPETCSNPSNLIIPCPPSPFVVVRRRPFNQG